jgi:hypothetical protein
MWLSGVPAKSKLIGKYMSIFHAELDLSDERDIDVMNPQYNNFVVQRNDG